MPSRQPGESLRDYWQRRAEEARTMAEGFRNPETRRILLSIAESYESLAELARKNPKAE
jgi:hypothetical protein